MKEQDVQVSAVSLRTLCAPKYAVVDGKCEWLSPLESLVFMHGADERKTPSCRSLLSLAMFSRVLAG